ncbi:hypothetical protein SASPL_144213 [Salvia splendens]|uniref:Enolase-phosphatase E1 n=1 Tax=Salvia splendens TaxID=180675 RepID=A0A8X8ZA72_SALSN|nr:hypothetical protein SASPL_144213 [Salvia splendens]
MAAAVASSPPIFLVGRVKQTKAIVCSQFKHLGWVSGVLPPSGSVLPKPSKLLKRVLGTSRNTPVTAKAGTSINELQRCIVLDIEGTTTPISFVTDVLFPYARDNVGKHLELTYDTAETQDDIELLRAQVLEDVEKNVVGAVPIPTHGDREEVIASVVANVQAMIKADRKITSLKQLQGHIWRTGFRSNEIEAVVYNDVPEALEKWRAMGLKVLCAMLFHVHPIGAEANFWQYELRNKKETKSYQEISESLGVDDPSQILFVTDVYQEATAAKAAGLEVIISIRPGNGPLPENHGFQTTNSLSEMNPC